MKKVIFDTDIGIDDAMALLYLHYAPEVDLLAIVTGFGNASIEATTRNALHVKERFNIAATVHRGAADAVGARLGDGYPDFVHGKNGLGDIDLPEPTIDADPTSGADAIIDLVKKNPNEISIVAVGRMTNLAVALEKCPELPSLVREVVVMGGAFGYNDHRGNVSPVAEANIAGDPTAADRVFTAGFALTIVGLDVTEETVADSDYFDRLRQSAGHAGEFIHQISRHYIAFHEETTGSRRCPIHDSSAVAYLLRPELYKTEQRVVRVVTDGLAMGQTIAAHPHASFESLHWQDKPAVNVCTAVNASAVLGHYEDILRLSIK